MYFTVYKIGVMGSIQVVDSGVLWLSQSISIEPIVSDWFGVNRHGVGGKCHAVLIFLLQYC
jgi:hypothetical protein